MGMNCTLVFDRHSFRRRQKNMEKAQAYVDSECIRCMTPFVPVGLPRFHNSGKLAASAKVKSAGLIEYTAPFAEHDYYADIDHSHSGNPKAQRLWFEVMKSKDGKPILIGAAKILGCGYE